MKWRKRQLAVFFVKGLEFSGDEVVEKPCAEQSSLCMRKLSASDVSKESLISSLELRKKFEIKK